MGDLNVRPDSEIPKNGKNADQHADNKYHNVFLSDAEHRKGGAIGEYRAKQQKEQGCGIAEIGYSIEGKAENTDGTRLKTRGNQGVYTQHNG